MNLGGENVLIFGQFREGTSKASEAYPSVRRGSLRGADAKMAKIGTFSLLFRRRRDGSGSRVTPRSSSGTPADDWASAHLFHRGGSWRILTSADHCARSPPKHCREHTKIDALCVDFCVFSVGSRQTAVGRRGFKKNEQTELRHPDRTLVIPTIGGIYTFTTVSRKDLSVPDYKPESISPSFLFSRI